MLRAEEDVSDISIAIITDRTNGANSDMDSDKSAALHDGRPPRPQGIDDSRAGSAASNFGNDEQEKINDNTHGKTARHETSSSCYTCTRQPFDQINKVRKLAGKFVNNKNVQLFIVALIGINGIMMGIGTFDFIRENEVADNAFETVDQIFLVIFTVELGLQLVYHGWRVFLDGWLTFDFIIVTVSWSFASVQIVRAFRIFRALRLITRIKVMKNLILALFSVIPRMFAIGLLLFLVSYIFAVMFTQLFKNLFEEGYTDYNYFGRIDETFFTLFQLMTLDNWADVARQVMVAYTWAWLPFIIFVIITGFVVVNLIIAVICDAVAALEDEERAKLHGTFEANHSEESQHPALQEDVREQLDVLETYVDELASMQEQTLRTLQILTQQIADHKKAREEENSISSTSSQEEEQQREVTK
ncbi:hypothetical protein ACA910_020649 [Epithemia clementina (nom. ined.)]